MPEPIEPEVVDPEVVVVEPEDPAGAEDLGDAGKKALDAMKTKWKTAEKSGREALAELAKRDAAAANKDKPAEEQALEAARAEARAEANTASNARLVKVELRAAAKGKLADPTDAHLYINLDDFDVNDDGEVDSAALEDAIDELLTRKPHLAAGEPRKFAGSADQGAKPKATRVQQLTGEDLKSLSPQQIVAAKNAGQLDDYLKS